MLKTIAMSHTFVVNASFHSQLRSDEFSHPPTYLTAIQDKTNNIPYMSIRNNYLRLRLINY
jgi:hypothetical protein